MGCRAKPDSFRKRNLFISYEQHRHASASASSHWTEGALVLSDFLWLAEAVKGHHVCLWTVQTLIPGLSMVTLGTRCTAVTPDTVGKISVSSMPVWCYQPYVETSQGVNMLQDAAESKARDVPSRTKLRQGKQNGLNSPINSILKEKKYQFTPGTSTEHLLVRL